MKADESALPKAKLGHPSISGELVVAGRKSAAIDWQVIYEIYSDPRLAPADRAAEAMRRGVDRSAVQVERYFVAADLVCRYHATDLVSLSAVSDRVWHQLEERLLVDLEEQVDNPDPDSAYRERDRILGQVTRPMLERAAAGWHAWEAGQAIAAAGPAEPDADPPPGQGEVAAPGARRWRPGWPAAVVVFGVLALVVGLSLALRPRRPGLAVEYVGLLPESYMNRSELPPGHDFVGYRFRVHGDNFDAVASQTLWQMIERPPDCPATGFGFQTPDSVDLFIYCTTEMVPGQYRLGIRVPDGRSTATTFTHPAR